MKKKIVQLPPVSYNSIIFTEIYLRNYWGGEKKQFYSGPGSYNPLLKGYVDAIENFIVDNDVKDIVEIGCGDFNVTSQILDGLDHKNYPYRYFGYDVVKPLIKRNRDIYQRERVKFACKDACTGALKKGDLLIIRQVLQHLSNNAICQIVEKFKEYKFIIATEHQLVESNPDTPNLDIRTGGDIRLQRGSGVFLEEEPFNCEVLSLLYAMPEASCGRTASINSFLIKGGLE